jgi:hypothetical protein
MTWLAWRQHRQQALFGAASLALLAAFFLLTGAHMHSVLDSSGLSRCLARHGDCGGLQSDFEGRFSVWRGIQPVFLVLPLLVGLFWGAPLVARELEQGTHRLVWTQGVGRLRWLGTKLGLVLGTTLLLAAAYAALATWWLAPLMTSTGDRFQPGIFDEQGLAPAAYAFFAVALGMAAGAIVRRTLPAMAVTLVGFLALRIGIAGFARSHFMAPVKVSGTPTPSTDLNHMGGWLLSRRTVDGSGHPTSIENAYVTCNAHVGASVQAVVGCIHRLGFVNTDVFQPASRFWLFQGIEAAVYGGVAVGLLALAVYWVSRRVS